MTNNHKKDLVSGAYWSLIGQFGYLGTTLIANIILARVLSPSEFGQLGIVLFFIVIARVLTESGLGGALVRNNNATNVDYSTIFIFNLFISIFLCAVLIGSSGFIADFYRTPSLKPLLIASSFILIINAFQFVQSAKLVKQMRFKQKAIYDFVSIFIAAVIGITLALNDFGVWSLVVMQLVAASSMTLLYWTFEGGYGSLVFNKDSFNYHFKFGVNTTLASILNSLFDNIYQAILGKYFAISQTGLFFQAKKLQEIPVGVINNLTQSVLFSGLSKIQDDKELFKQTYQKVIRIFTVLVGFISLILFVFAREIILLILGEQWVEGTFFLQILTIVGFFNMQEMFNRIIFKIYNDTRYIIILEFVNKLIQMISIMIGLYTMNMKMLMYGFVTTSLISYLFNNYFIRKKYPFLDREILLSVIKIFFISVLIVLLQFYLIDFDLSLLTTLFRIVITTSLFFVCSYSLGILKYKGTIKIFNKNYD